MVSGDSAIFDGVLLVRHAHSVVDLSREASEWRLSSAGIAAAAELAAVVAAHRPDVVVSSPERKAVQTARPIAERLGVKLLFDDRLREHRPTGFLPPADFQLAVQTLFQRPDEEVFGESANTAAARVRAAIERHGNAAAFVSHGRALSAFLALCTGCSGWEIWRDLRMPDLLRMHSINGALDFVRLDKGP